MRADHLAFYLSRLTAEQALKHPYVAQFHNPDEEPICTKKIHIPIDDNQKFSIKEYRNKLYSDIHKRRKEMRKKLLAQHQAYYQQMGRSSAAGQSQHASSHGGAASQSSASQQQQYTAQ